MPFWVSPDGRSVFYEADDPGNMTGRMVCCPESAVDRKAETIDRSQAIELMRDGKWLA